MTDLYQSLILTGLTLPGLREHDKKCFTIYVSVNLKWVGLVFWETYWAGKQQSGNKWHSGMRSVLGQFPGLWLLTGAPFSPAGPGGPWGPGRPGRPMGPAVPAAPRSPGEPWKRTGDKGILRALVMLVVVIRQVNKDVYQLRIHHCVQVKKKGWEDRLEVHTRYSSDNTDRIFCKHRFLYLFI